MITHQIRVDDVQRWLDDVQSQRQTAVLELRDVQTRYLEITDRVRDLGRVAATLAEVLRVTRDTVSSAQTVEPTADF